MGANTDTVTVYRDYTSRVDVKRRGRRGSPRESSDVLICRGTETEVRKRKYGNETKIADENGSEKKSFLLYLAL